MLSVRLFGARLMRGAPFFLVSASLAGSMALAAAPAARFELPANPDAIVLSFSERLGEIQSEDHPWLRVHADGRVVAHRPSYLKNAGTFTSSISPDEMKGLLQTLADRGIMEFDPKAVVSELAAEKSKNPTLFEASDVSIFEIRVRLKEYQPAGSLTVNRDFEKDIEWSGLRRDAKRFPQVAGVQALSAAVSDLQALAQRTERLQNRDSMAGGER